MDAKRRRLRRQQLDQQFSRISDAALVNPPKGGWVRAIRESLGMTLNALGQKLGVTRQSAQQLEVAEVYGSITVKRLRSVAEALNCDLVIALVPRMPLEEMVQERARSVALDLVRRTGHSMALESQGLIDERIDQMVREAAEELIVKGDPRIWE